MFIPPGDTLVHCAVEGSADRCPLLPHSTGAT
jgi:hypothetical protein